MNFIQCVIVLVVTCLAQCQAGLQNLHRYWNPELKDHFYTTNFAELGYGKDGFYYEGVACKLTSFEQANTLPLYRYCGNGDHFYTTNLNEMGGGRDGYKLEGTAGRCFPSQQANTIPLYRYKNTKYTDHFYTTNAAEIGVTTPGLVGFHGYMYEGVACYVYSI